MSTRSKAMGGPSSTTEFARLFLVPGMSHCGLANGGPGVRVVAPENGFDQLPIMEKWVEEGAPPESILMTKRDKAGNTERARPVCAYPQMARFSGAGDWREAANWTCTAP